MPRRSEVDTAEPAAAEDETMMTRQSSEADGATISASAGELSQAAHDEVDLLRDAALKRRPSRLAKPLRFPLVVLLSLAISTVAHSFLDQVVGNELGAVTRRVEENWEVVAVMGWGVFELALAWFGNYDALDLAALKILSHGPSLFLLHAFYGVRASTAAANFGVDVLSCLLPFLFLRPLSGAHSASAKVPNREIVTDRIIQMTTVTLAGLMYHVVFYIACKSEYLPNALVLYFNGIPSIKAATEATLIGFEPGSSSPDLDPLIVTKMATFSLFGLAAHTFLFAPFAAAPTGTDADVKVENFDPASASLSETVWWNVWGFTQRTRMLIVRTAGLAVLIAVNTYLRCTLRIEGVEPAGATAYASIWVAAAVGAALALGWVGDV